MVLRNMWRLLVIVYFVYSNLEYVTGCDESCRFSYDGSFAEFKQRCDQATTGHIVVTDRAIFNGDSFLSLPMFQQNSLRPAFSIAFIFRYTGRSRDDVAILSNGCDGIVPTIELKLQTLSQSSWTTYANTTLSLRMTNDNRDMNISVRNTKVNVFRPVLVQIAQNETAVEVQVDGQPRQTFAKDVNDYIMQSECPLQVGAGTGLVNFVGEFDEFVYFPCVNPGFFSIANLF